MELSHLQNRVCTQKKGDRIEFSGTRGHYVFSVKCQYYSQVGVGKAEWVCA